MTSWKVTDAEGEVRDALRAAIWDGVPQHLLLEGEGEAVVLRADEYARLLEARPEETAPVTADDGSADRVSDAPRPSSGGAVGGAGDAPGERDSGMREGGGPGHRKRARGDRTGADLLEFMRNSPWAEAVRTGFWPWVWDDDTRDWVLPEKNAVSP